MDKNKTNSSNLQCNSVQPGALMAEFVRQKKDKQGNVHTEWYVLPEYKLKMEKNNNDYAARQFFKQYSVSRHETEQGFEYTKEAKETCAYKSNRCFHCAQPYLNPVRHSACGTTIMCFACASAVQYHCPTCNLHFGVDSVVQQHLDTKEKQMHLETLHKARKRQWTAIEGSSREEDKLVLQQIGELSIHCPQRRYFGCSWTGSRSDFQTAHASTCAKQLMEQKQNQCTQCRLKLLDPVLLVQHFANCANAFRHCLFCNAKGNKKWLEYHQRTCTMPFQVVNCLMKPEVAAMLYSQWSKQRWSANNNRNHLNKVVDSSLQQQNSRILALEKQVQDMKQLLEDNASTSGNPKTSAQKEKEEQSKEQSDTSPPLHAVLVLRKRKPLALEPLFGENNIDSSVAEKRLKSA
jgi:hypothetical protein